MLQKNVSLSSNTTLKTGGVASYYVELVDEAGLVEAADFILEQNLPYLVLGGGSNLLVSDHGFSGVVLKMLNKGRDYQDQDDATVVLSVAAGEVLDDVIADTVSRGLWGLENLSSIPGTVGAVPIQNVGAYGVEASSVVHSVDVYHLPTKTKKVFTNSECNFGYRDSFFKSEIGREYIITKVNFILTKKYQPKISYADLAKKFLDVTPTQLEVRDALIKIRAEKFPDWRVLGTAGSFFKNPIVANEVGEALRLCYPDLPVYVVDNNRAKLPLGYILDKVCNLKGFRVGDVGLYEAQALVLVNYKNATAAEIISFVKIVSEKVFEKTKIIIEPEVQFVGEFL